MTALITDHRPITRDDPMAEIEDVLGSWNCRRRAFAQRQAGARAARQQFERDADVLAGTVIRPTFDAIAVRLNAHGGGGQVDERPGDDSHAYRATLWMALDGPIATPRQDRNPYLQLDLDVPGRQIRAWECDVWDKQGASRESTPWQLGEITEQSLTHRAVAILRRAATHDMVA
jgi:hypothetical protein